ncbi:TonB-dependent receptor [Methylophilaceae bacterium]|nr:TonB-dependent receptor [Methylophilaceae bacterium]
MSKFKIALPLLLALPQMAIADLALEEIKVTTPLRIPEEEKNVIADTTVITSGEIERAGLSTLPQLLQQQPGIEITNSGGPGKVSTVSIRGTKSTHTLILLDGMRIGSATTGLAPIQDMPLSQIEKIEIIRGPASSLYGQDAIGGVIQIFTKKGKKGFHPYISAGYGRYKTKEMAAGVSAGNDSTRFAINLAGVNTDAFSAFVPDDSNASNTRNIDKDHYKNRSVSSNLSHQFNEQIKIDLQYFLTTGKNMFDQRYANSDPTYVNYDDKTKQEAYGAKITGKINDRWESSLKIGKSTDIYSAQQAWDPNLGAYGEWVDDAVDLYKTKEYQLSWQNNVELDYGSLVLLYDFLKEEIETTDIYDKDQRTNNGFVIGYNLQHDKHTFQTSLREDLNSQYDNQTTGSIGYAYQINPQWRISSSYGTAFVAPNFNYLYSTVDLSALGNPDLKPEKSKNIEASLRYENNSSSISLTAYQNTIKDYIIWSYIDSGYRENTRNIDEAKIQGLTLATDHFFDNLQIKGSITTESAKNEVSDNYLPRSANLYGSVNFNYYLDDWIFGIENIGSGSRYDDDANKSVNKIEGYIITNLVTNYAFNEKFSINMRLDNALNKDYALAYDGSQEGDNSYVYQTPGRGLYTNLRYNF